MPKPIDKKGKPVFVGICHMDDETGQYEPHQVQAKQLAKFLANHPDDILMPEDGVCPVIVEDGALPDVIE